MLVGGTIVRHKTYRLSQLAYIKKDWFSIGIYQKSAITQPVSGSLSLQVIQTVAANLHVTLPRDKIFFAVIDGVDDPFRDDIRRNPVNGSHFIAASSTVDHGVT